MTSHYTDGSAHDRSTLRSSSDVAVLCARSSARNFSTTFATTPGEVVSSRHPLRQSAEENRPEENPRGGEPPLPASSYRYRSINAQHEMPSRSASGGGWSAGRCCSAAPRCSPSSSLPRILHGDVRDCYGSPLYLQREGWGCMYTSQIPSQYNTDGLQHKRKPQKKLFISYKLPEVDSSARSRDLRQLRPTAGILDLTTTTALASRRTSPVHEVAFGVHRRGASWRVRRQERVCQLLIQLYWQRGELREAGHRLKPAERRGQAGRAGAESVRQKADHGRRHRRFHPNEGASGAERTPGRSAGYCRAGARGARCSQPRVMRSCSAAERGAGRGVHVSWCERAPDSTTRCAASARPPHLTDFLHEANVMIEHLACEVGGWGNGMWRQKNASASELRAAGCHAVPLGGSPHRQGPRSAGGAGRCCPSGAPAGEGRCGRAGAAGRRSTAAPLRSMVGGEGTPGRHPTEGTVRSHRTSALGWR